MQIEKRKQKNEKRTWIQQEKSAKLIVKLDRFVHERIAYIRIIVLMEKLLEQGALRE